MINIFLLNEVRELAEDMITILERAERGYRIASVASIYDLLRGNIFAGIAKYASVSNADDELEKLNQLTNRLNSLLKDIEIPIFYRQKFGAFATFGDFVFDGILFDSYSAIKIFAGLEEVCRVKKRLLILLDALDKLY